MKKCLLFLCLISFNLFAFDYPKIPNKETSPGDTCSLSNPDFKEYRYGEQIIYCQRNVSTATKTKIYEMYGVPKSERGDYTIDHIIPLSIGGSNNIKNLWAEHKFVKQTRPNLELELYEQLRDGRITQQQAIDIILDEKFKN